MAKKVTATLVDDYDAAAGREVSADQTVSFSLDGRDYEIDLCTKNATKMRSDVSKWIEAARVVGRDRRRRPASAIVNARLGVDGMSNDQRKACRAWARGNGWPELGTRGRLPEDAIAAFLKGPAVSA